MKIQEYYQMEKVKKSQYHLILAAGRTWSQLLDYGTAREDIVRLVSVLAIQLQPVGPCTGVIYSWL